MNDIELEANYCKLLLSLPKNAEILDIGCGDGRMIKYLIQKGYVNVSGVDRSVISQEINFSNPNIKIESAAVGPEWFCAHSKKYDLIIMRQMIYYVDRLEIESFLVEMKKIINTNGQVLIEIFNGNLITSNFVYIKDPFIKTLYNEYSLQRLFNSFGYKINGIYEVVTPYEPGIRSFLYRMLRFLWVSILRIIFFAERGLSERPTIFSKLHNCCG